MTLRKSRPRSKSKSKDNETSINPSNGPNAHKVVGQDIIENSTTEKSLCTEREGNLDDVSTRNHNVNNIR